jgi:hypothetical protein
LDAYPTSHIQSAHLLEEEMIHIYKNKINKWIWTTEKSGSKD